MKTTILTYASGFGIAAIGMSHIPSLIGVSVFLAALGIYALMNTFIGMRIQKELQP